MLTWDIALYDKVPTDIQNAKTIFLENLEQKLESHNVEETDI